MPKNDKLGEQVVNTIGVQGQEVAVLVIKVPGMAGYRFDAAGLKSLPLAVDLAVRQTQGKLAPIDEIHLR